MKEVHDFWESQASKENLSGTQDYVLDQLEKKALESIVPTNMHTLEIGCGDGRNAINLKEKLNLEIDAFDYSSNMIKLAKKNAENAGVKVNFFVFDVRYLSGIKIKYDLVITKRVIINLSNTDEQVQALKDVSGLLNNRGLFIMCESSKQGLENINHARRKVGLELIIPPWHNVYIDENRVNYDLISETGLELIKRIDFSSAYYFLSRVVNAKIASLDGKAPSYDSPINKIALNIDSFGNFGQSVIWVWKKL